MFTFRLCGIEVTRVWIGRQVMDAITALDVKITDYQKRCNMYRNYWGSGEGYAEMSEIVGELKFMYLSGVLRQAEYRKILGRVTGEILDDNVRR